MAAADADSHPWQRHPSRSSTRRQRFRFEPPASFTLPRLAFMMPVESDREVPFSEGREGSRPWVSKQSELTTKNVAGESPIPAAGNYDGDAAEQAIADTEADLQIRLHQTDGRLLRAIEAALGRITHGTFGVCEICHNPITKARLEAVPWTHHCRDCKEQEHL